MHTHTGNPCSICGFPLTGMDAVNFLQGGVKPAEVFRIIKKEPADLKHAISLEEYGKDLLKKYTEYLNRNGFIATYLSNETMVDEFLKEQRRK